MGLIQKFISLLNTKNQGPNADDDFMAHYNIPGTC